MATAAPLHHIFLRPSELSRCFLLRTGLAEWLGVKTPVRDAEGRRRLSGVLRRDMVLGRFEGFQFTENGVSLAYLPSPKAGAEAAPGAGAHAGLVAAALSDPRAEIVFPFPHLDDTWREQLCGQEQVSADGQLAPFLDGDEDGDEAHFRAHTVHHLSQGLRAGSVVYDPACSTGALLADLRRALPQVSVADARQPPGPDETVDVLVLRFLNSEVVTVAQSVDLFDTLIGTLAPDGQVLAFGRTPLVLPVHEVARRHGLTVVSRVAGDATTDTLFQYYVLARRHRATGHRQQATGQ
ncbi:hypothetical protein [Streptomyces sp. NPDC059009]|uniref:hypothetical protein n=1 Tax=Streptomyces sp. NPDC059009 TaxID=3346694 RepID=UPI0036BEBF8A